MGWGLYQEGSFKAPLEEFGRGGDQMGFPSSLELSLEGGHLTG